MKKQDIVNLIKYHTDKDEVSFVNTASNVARAFLEEGDEQIAKYIVGLLSGPIAYSPQDLSDNYGFFKLVSKQSDFLYLPYELKKELDGVITALKSNFGINKIIFEGKPGTGKTQSALIIAKALKRELLVVNANTIIDSRLGQSAKNLSDMFEFANRIAKKGNYIFLIDEIDSLVMDRINSRDLREMGRLTSAFLQELDNLDPNAVLIATTNLYKELDKALTRRFDASISFDRYSKEDIGELACKFLQNFSIDTDLYQMSDLRLLEKLFKNSSIELSPSETKNLIRLSLAFSGSNKRKFFGRVCDNLGYSFGSKNIDKSYIELFTTRELETLTGISKSTIARSIKGDKNGL